MKKKPAIRRGRPPKKSGKLALRIQFAADEPRKARYVKAADQAGVDLSEWIRRHLDRAAEGQAGK